jgi:hypothetical protein
MGLDASWITSSQDQWLIIISGGKVARGLILERGLEI